MPLKQDQVEMFLFPTLVSALAAVMVLSTQQVSALGCEDTSCDSRVNIDGINIGKIGDDKILNPEEINKILGNDETKLDNVQSADDVNSDNNDNNDKIKIKDLNVLLDDDDDNRPKIEILPDNVTVVKIKDFKILIPKK